MFLFTSVLMTAIGVGLSSLVNETMVGIPIVITGIIHGGFMTVLFTMVTATKEIGTTYARTAMGLILTSLGWLLLFLPPSSNGIADNNPILPFIL